MIETGPVSQPEPPTRPQGDRARPPGDQGPARSPALKICQLCAVDFTLYHFLLPLMERLRARGHQVVGMCSDGPLLERVRARGFRVETVPFARSVSPGAQLRAYRALVPILRREGFDMLHAHTPVASVVARLAAWRTGVPRRVYTAHGFYFHDRMPPLKRAVFTGVEWLAGRLTHTLLTVSAEDAETARRLHLCRGTIAAVGNGADPERFRPPGDRPEEAAAARRGARAGFAALDPAPDKPLIVAVGRLVAEKGYLELIEAMRSVDAVLWIVGERLVSDHAGDVAAALAAAQEDPLLSTRIRLLGYREDVPELLRAADIFVLPSHREGLPMSIIEAMLSGLPVVATDIRGSREQVVPGETGEIVPVGDPAALAAALNRLAADPPLRQAYGAAARRRGLAFYDEAKVLDRQIEMLGL